MKLKDEVSDRIKEKIKLLKSRKAHKKVISDVLYPSRQKEKNRRIAESYADDLDKKIKVINPLIRSLRSHIDYIGDSDKFVASYLLIGKAYTSLKAVSILVRQGFSFQIVEIVRSSIESLSLVALFLEEGQEKLLEQWFNGGIISNRMARDVMNAAVNKVNQASGGGSLPVKEALSDVYSLYSSYTHSGYSALFDFIDVFTEDFDFGQHSQYHYNQENLHLIDNLYVNILLELKNYFIRAKDEDNYKKVQTLLSKEGGSFANLEEIGKELKRYRPKNISSK